MREGGSYIWNHTKEKNTDILSGKVPIQKQKYEKRRRDHPVSIEKKAVSIEQDE